MGINSDESVLVIGAGIAGLKAASDLNDKGYQVEVLEAASHIGGRVHTHFTSDGQALEIGGNWLHNDAPNHPIRELIRKVESSSENLRGTSLEESVLTHSSQEEFMSTAAIHRGGGTSSIKTSREGLEVLGIYTYHDQTHEDYVPEGTDVPNLDEYIHSLVEDKLGYLEWNKDIRSSVAGILNLLLSDGGPSNKFAMSFDYSGISPDASQAHQLGGGARLLGKQDDDYFVSRGMDRILEPLKGDYPITTGASVTKVSKLADGKLSVEYTQNGQTHSWVGDRVICTAPLGVLKQENGIEFSPSLSDAKREAIQSLGMKNIRKLYFTFSKEAFEKANIEAKALMFTDNGHADLFFNINALSGYTSAENPTIAAWITSDNAFASDETYKEGSLELKEKMLATLTKYYPSLNSESLIEYLDKAWGQDRNTHGCYSYVPKSDGYKHMFEMVNPEFDGKLIFAGEHTNPTHEATIHGAYLSGQRAAYQVMHP